MNRNLRTAIIGTISTFAGASFWGLCAVVSQYLINVKGLDTMWMTNFRMLMSGLILLSLAILRNPHHFMDIWKDRRSALRLLAVALFGFAICQLTYFLAIEYCNAGIATALQQTAPVMVIIYVLIKERRTPSFVEIGVVLMVVFGSFMLATNGDFRKLSIPLIALIMGLISAVTCAMYTMLPGKLIKRYGTFETVGWGLSLAGIMVSPISKIWVVSGTFDVETWLGLSFIILPGAVAAFALFLYGVTIVGPVRGSIYGLCEPILATVASALWLGQYFSPSDIVGMIAILGGILWLTLSGSKLEKQIEPCSNK